MAGVRHAAARGLTLRAAVTAVTAQSGVSERTLWRWLGRDQSAAPHTAWQPSPEDLVIYARWCANASAAWRERRDAGADVPALRTYQQGMAAALTPGQRAGLRAGELARREYDAYLRWEPEARNDLWEADHKQLDVDVRAQGFERPVRPWLTLFVEAYSRVVPGWALDTVLAFDPERRPVLAAVGTPLPDVGFPALPAACAALLEPQHAARAQAIYDECLVAAFDALVADGLLDRRDAEHAFRCALVRAPDLAAVALATHAVRAAGILRGYHIGFEEHYGGVAFDHLLTGDRLAQLARLLSPAQAAAGVLAGMSASWLSVDIARDGGRVDLGGVGHVVPAAARPLMRAWAQTRSKPLQAPSGRPPRPPDAGAGLLWRTPPPERLSVDCQPIDCRSFRRSGDPPMGWTRPPASHRRRGPARSPAPD